MDTLWRANVLGPYLAAFFKDGGFYTGDHCIYRFTVGLLLAGLHEFSNIGSAGIEVRATQARTFTLSYGYRAGESAKYNIKLCEYTAKVQKSFHTRSVQLIES